MNTEQQYIKGFNTGYLLTKYELEVSQKVIKNLPHIGEYFQGIFEGNNMAHQEQQLVKVEELKMLRSREQNREKGIDDIF